VRVVFTETHRYWSDRRALRPVNERFVLASQYTSTLAPAAIGAHSHAVVPYAAYAGKYLAYFTHGALAQFLVVCTLKVCIGRLRPDFYDVCQPTNVTVDYCSTHPNSYLDNINCTYISREVRV
jgi:hypothetical protein